MNKEVMLTRLKDVLNVDSINSSQADFLSTHVPFREITVTNDLSGTPISERISEEDIFNKYFEDSSKYNQHQLIVVDGSSGSGKSHFIRWIEAKLSANEIKNDVVLMIRRSDNTLKGTIKQFLNIEEVKSIRNKDIYERLVKANQNVSEQKFKFEIYHKFLVEIADDDESVLSNSDRKNFRELLSSSEFEERMLMPGGPIDRIYSKIVDNNELGEDVLALFNIDDFILDYDFNMKLKNNASKRAVKMANKLLPEDDGSFPDEDCNPKKIVEYMNSKVEPVIKACAGLEPGDFQQIFKEIRQELYSQGKNLILLIEDITSCTGINRDLLDALIVEHTGSNEIDKMCRLISVIGTTTEYFREFRSNYLDRITTMITIEDGAIGNTQSDLIQFVAKYLNVMSLSKEVITKWYQDGAIETEYPVHVDSEVENWDFYKYFDKKISLYPFTKKAIINLYNGLDVHKTPRYIIRRIIEPAVEGIIQNKKLFPKFLFSRRPNLEFDVIDRVKSIIVNIQLSEDEKDILEKKLFAILGYWGDGNLDISKKGYIGGISTAVFKEFGLSLFAERLLGTSLDNAIYEGDSDNEISEQNAGIKPVSSSVKFEPEKKQVVNKDFEDFVKILSEWHYDKKSFTKAYKVRDEIKRFIISNISWQQEGVPLVSVQFIEKTIYDLVEIERQDKKVGKGLILLKDDDETYQLLLAIGKSFYLGKKRTGNIEYASWDFEGSASSLRIATCWLERNKKRFIDVVKACDKRKKYPDYLKCCIIAEVYRGLLNGDYRVSKISDIKTEVLLKDNESRSKTSLEGHSKEWSDLVNFMYISDAAINNIDTIHRYFNLIQGNDKNAKRKIINYNFLDNVFKELRNEGFDIAIDEIDSDIINGRNVSIEYLKKILSKVERVVSAEIEEGKELYRNVLKYFGFVDGTEIETEDIKDLLNEVIEFYNDAEINGINIFLRTDDATLLKNKSVEIAKALERISADVNGMSIIEKIILYSSNPMKIVKQLLDFLRLVDKDNDYVYSEMKLAKENLTRSGVWSDDVDPRFEQNQSDFDRLMKLMEG